MKAVETLARAREHGVKVIPAGGRLRLRAPAEPPREIIEALRRNKREVLAWLTHQHHQRALVTFNLTEAPDAWPVVIGAPGETDADCGGQVISDTAIGGSAAVCCS